MELAYALLLYESDFVFKSKFEFFSVYLRCVGGEVGATSALAPKVGPLGLVSIFQPCYFHFVFHISSCDVYT